MSGSNTFHTFQVMLDPITITANNPSLETKSFLTGIRIPVILYISGTFIFSFMLFYRFFQIIRLIRRHKVNRINRIKMVTAYGGFAPASFFSYVFVSGPDNLDEIIEHENVHVRQGHSYDIVLIEILKIVLWFNPFVWIYQSAIKNLHEYLADEGTLQKGYDSKRYQRLVFENTFGIKLNGLAVSFNYSPLKKRLKMMTKNKSGKLYIWQYLLIIPVITITFLVFSFDKTGNNDNIEVENPITELNESETVPPPPPPPLIDTSGEVFFIVEDMPTFNGGKAEEFRKFITGNLKYPDEAVKNGIYGKVFVQFEINSEGYLANARIIRSVHPLLDTEALRVVNSSPQWEPGKQRGEPVMVSFTFPINFVLQDK